jgi:predicted metal-dependent hydrolase
MALTDPACHPAATMPQHFDARVLAGIDHFNRGEYFDAHEVWEDVWRESDGAAASFFKGLIQAAVSLYHLDRGNLAGARRLFASGQAYMLAAGSPFLGLDVRAFWQQMEAYFAARLGGAPGPPPAPRLNVPGGEP